MRCSEQPVSAVVSIVGFWLAVADMCSEVIHPAGRRHPAKSAQPTVN